MSLILHDITLQRGSQTLLAGFGLRVDAGQMVMLKGPNGCGKSSLLRCIAGLLPAARGRVDWQGAGEIVAQRLFIATRPPLEPRLTVRDHIRFWAGLFGARDVDEAALLARIGLLLMADRPVRHLSTGQAQRLSLSRLALHPGKLWLLDEPTLGLDVAGKALLADWLADHLAKGGLILTASHEEIAPDLPVHAIEMQGRLAA